MQLVVHVVVAVAVAVVVVVACNLLTAHLVFACRLVDERTCLVEQSVRVVFP